MKAWGYCSVSSLATLSMISFVRFLDICIATSEYPNRFWNHLKRNRDYSNYKTLNCHALNNKKNLDVWRT